MMRALAQRLLPPDLVVVELDIVGLGALRLRAARRQQLLLQLRHGQLLRPCQSPSAGSWPSGVAFSTPQGPRFFGGNRCQRRLKLQEGDFPGPLGLDLHVCKSTALNLARPSSTGQGLPRDSAGGTCL